MSFPCAHSGLPLRGSRRQDSVRTARRVELRFVVESAEAEDGVAAYRHRCRGQDSLHTVERTQDFQAQSGTLRRLQQRLPATKRGSYSRNKKRAMVAGERQRVRQAECGHMHELTRVLVDHHGARFFACLSGCHPHPLYVWCGDKWLGRRTKRGWMFCSGKTFRLGLTYLA